MMMLMLKVGVPWNIAETWSEERKWAALIKAGQINGGTWDWKGWRWEEQK